MDEVCPICKYSISECQCLFSGSSHTDKQKNYEVAIDHLYLLSSKQLTHIIELQRIWQIDYEDKQMNEILNKLKEEYNAE